MTSAATRFVYLIAAPNGLYKLGQTHNPTQRLKGIAKAQHRLTLLASIPTDAATRWEFFLHGAFSHRRVQGEWFRLTDAEVSLVCDVNSLVGDVAGHGGAMLTREPSRDGVRTGDAVRVWVVNEYEPAVVVRHWEWSHFSGNVYAAYTVRFAGGAEMNCGRNSMMHFADPDWDVKPRSRKPKGKP